MAYFGHVVEIFFHELITSHKLERGLALGFVRTAIMLM